LSLRYGNRCGEAGDQEYDSVETTSPKVKVLTRVMELSQMVVPHDREATEHHREKKDFCSEEEPHTELCGSVRCLRIHVMDMWGIPRGYVVINDWMGDCTHNIPV
jgi:hypothetical protein